MSRVSGTHRRRRVTVDHNSTTEPGRPARHALGPALVGQHAGPSAGHGRDRPLLLVGRGPANAFSLSWCYATNSPCSNDARHGHG